MNRKRLIATATALAALAAPAVAGADSIVYLEGAAVWSAAPDGSHKVQLTDTGMYHSVTQADDGTIAAAGSGAIDILARDGRPLRSIATVPAKTGNGGWHRGTPDNLSFSPDGTKIAYDYNDLACPPASSCMIQHSTLYTTSEGPAASPHDQFGQQWGRSNPSFVTNDRALVFGGYGHNVNLDPLGGGDGSNDLWFTNDGDWDDGELSRDGTRLAVNFGYDENTRLGFLRVSGDPRTGIPTAPTIDDTVCETGRDKDLHGASWSPDGNALAYGSSKGVEIVRFSSFAPGNCGVSGESVLTSLGKEPDWGPADPPARRWSDQAPVQAPQAGPAPAPAQPQAPAGPSKGADAPAPGGAKVRVTTARATVAALRKGLALKVAVPAAGRVTVSITSGGRKVATGKATARRAGAVTVRLSKVGARKAARLRGKRLKVTVTAGAAKASATLPVR